MKPIATYLLLAICCLAAQYTMAQSLPTNNPARARFSASAGFPTQGYHWTDSIRWDVVVNIQDFASLVRNVPTVRNTTVQPDSVKTWWYAFEAAQQSLLNLGGGVVYFPQLPPKSSGIDSAYYFHESLFLKAQVVLRGEEPLETNAKSRGFAPPTAFEFPKYEYALGAGQGRGTSNRSAFKAITIAPELRVSNSTGFKNIGVVDIDINRARIMFNPEFQQIEVPLTQIRYHLPATFSGNILVMGTRINNAVYPDPSVPNNSSAQNLWQRWPYRFSAGIHIFGLKNIFIAGNRINDFENNDRHSNRPITADDFEQPNYVATNCTTTISAHDARFSYKEGYGIVVNFFKATTDSSVLGSLQDGNVNQEPQTYAKGIRILNNWIYKEKRAGIAATGLGLKIENNELHDRPDKFSPIGASGANCINNVYHTYSSIGILFTGQNVQIENNEIEVYRTRLGISNNFYSIDGAAFQYGFQDSRPYSATIRNNVVTSRLNGLVNALNSAQPSAENGFPDSRGLFYSVIENNDFGHQPLTINMIGGIAPRLLSHLTVKNNTNIGMIFIRGCGENNKVYDNIASDSIVSLPPFSNYRSIRVDSSVCLNAAGTDCQTNQNNNFLSVQFNLAPTCQTLMPCTTPTLTISNIHQGEIWKQNNEPLPIAVEWSNTGCDPDSVQLIVNGRVAGVVKRGSTPLQSPVVFSNYRTAASGYGKDYIHAAYFVGSMQGMETPTPTVEVSYPIAALAFHVASQIPAVSLYPNPARDEVKLQGVENLSGQIVVYTSTGQQVLNQPLSSLVNVSKLNPGIYLLQVVSSEHRQVIRFVKE